MSIHSRPTPLCVAFFAASAKHVLLEQDLGTPTNTRLVFSGFAAGTILRLLDGQLLSTSERLALASGSSRFGVARHGTARLYHDFPRGVMYAL